MSLKFSFPRVRRCQTRASAGTAPALVFPVSAGGPGCGPAWDPSLLIVGFKLPARSSGQQKMSHFLPFSHLENTAGSQISDKEAAKLPATHYLLLISHFLAL